MLSLGRAPREHYIDDEPRGNADSPRGHQTHARVYPNIKARRLARKTRSPQIAELRAHAEPLRLQARDAQAAGDRLYWPIFNLDLKNPNAPEEETHDPDLLLEKYKKLLGEIEETENQLKSELAAALAHHFIDGDA